MNLLNKNARGWLIVAALILYLFPFYSLGLNKWPGWNLGELYTLGLELKDFLTVWTTLGGVVAVVIGIIQTQGRISLQKEQFEKQQRDTRFISGVELLGNSHESTRIGGAYNLYFLAREFPNSYLNPVCEILCAHLRSIAHKDKFKTDEERAKYPTNEVQIILDLLFDEYDKKRIFKNTTWRSLKQTYLSSVSLMGAELNSVGFFRAELINVAFFQAELGDVDFVDAELRDVSFRNAKLRHVRFNDISALRQEGAIGGN